MTNTQMYDNEHRRIRNNTYMKRISDELRLFVHGGDVIRAQHEGIEYKQFDEDNNDDDIETEV